MICSQSWASRASLSEGHPCHPHLWHCWLMLSLLAVSRASLIVVISQRTKLTVFAGPTAKSLLQQVVARGMDSDPLEVLLKRAAEQASGAPSVEALAEAIVRDMPKEVATYRQGKTNIVMRMVGEGMRRSGKRADAQALRTALEAVIERS